MRRVGWLLAAVILLGVAAWLMARGDRGKGKTAHDNIHFPRPRSRDDQRNARRRTLVLPPSPSATGPAVPQDPLMVALPNTPGGTTIVFEASAMRDSPIGQHMVDCLLGEREARELADAKRDFGVDVLEDVQRVGHSGPVTVVEGDFSEATWGRLAERWTPRPYGSSATLYAEPDRDQTIAVYGGQMVLFGEDAAEIEAAIDRLEGHLPPAPPAIPDWAMYGDVYGVIAVDTLVEFLQKDDDHGLADTFRNAVEQVELHVDTSDDVAIVADVVGPDKEAVGDLGKSLGAALSIARMRAQADGDERLADLLDLARISPRDGRFSLDLALPMDFLRKELGPCKRKDGGRAR